MGKIFQLPPHLIAKIAAGEVIERPAFAVKELIENSIDAGADEISIVVENAGLKKIQVTDNGEGMNLDDLQESINPHTTSKIIDDTLTGITTLGFRGEALASLAAVSALSIKSRTKEHATGNEIIILEGETPKVKPVGMPEGTVVTAENLFAHIPARKKFLKSPQTELRHITDVVTKFAASFPHIRFTLRHNNRTILDTPKNEKVIERIKNLVGAETFASFISVKAEDSFVSVTGFIAKPQIHTSSQNKQFLFINNRQVSDKLVSLAVKESYGNMLEPTAYPIFVLFITLAPEMIDVNVHPRKEHVLFLNSKTIFEFIKTTITQTLSDNNLTFQNLSWKRSGVGTTNTYAAQMLRESVLEKEVLYPKENTNLMQIHNVYILAQTNKGLLMFDQHATHERILFEKLLKEFKKNSETHKPHLLPSKISIEFTKTEQMIISEHKKFLEELGYRLDKKKNTIITHVPSMLRDRDVEETVKNILSYLEQDIPVPSIDTISVEMMAFLACRAAVKAGDRLEEKQMRKIITDLESTPNNATCPHGRPTRVFYSLEEINKSFKR